MSFTVKELSDKLEDLIDEEQAPFEDGWYSIVELESWRENDPNKTIDLPGFGTIEFVEQFGGEGQGDEYYVIFKIGDRYFKRDAWYSSWEGTDWGNGSLSEVKPVVRPTTFYEPLDSKK